MRLRDRDDLQPSTMLLERLLAAPRARQQRDEASHVDDTGPAPPVRAGQEDERGREAIEDVFSDALSLLFPDDVRNQHGLPGSRIVYRSPRHGEIELLLADPTEQDDRLLFAHYLWNASIVLTDLIERDGADGAGTRGDPRGGGRRGTDGGTRGRGRETTHLPGLVPVGGARDASGPVVTDGLAGSDRRRRWDVRGKKVLELGAGTDMLLVRAFFPPPLFHLSRRKDIHSQTGFLRFVYMSVFINRRDWSLRNHLRSSWSQAGSASLRGSFLSSWPLPIL